MTKTRLLSSLFRTLFSMLLFMRAFGASASPSDNAFDCLFEMGDTQQDCNSAADSCRRQCFVINPFTIEAYVACTDACGSQRNDCQDAAFSSFDTCLMEAPTYAIPLDNRRQVYQACTSMCYAESTFCLSLEEMTVEECLETSIECFMICEMELGDDPPF